MPNPFNSSQVTRISLEPDDVDVIVFWTRNPRPLLSHLGHLDGLGFPYYFHFTLLNYSRLFEPNRPSIKLAIQTFKELSDLIGPERIIWRYDPIVLTKATGPRFHQESYSYIAESLKGYTNRSMISLVDVYRKNAKRLKELGYVDEQISTLKEKYVRPFGDMIRAMVVSASANGMRIYSCAEEIDLVEYGIYPGRCIDDQYIMDHFDIQVTDSKDRGQRKLCGCVVSKDIGVYDSCLSGCRYCYATKQHSQPSDIQKKHQSNSPSLLGWFE